MPDGTAIEAARVQTSQMGPRDNLTPESCVQYDYQNTYKQPAILGQVMSNNDPRWSVFWSTENLVDGVSATDSRRVGLHAGEDPASGRSPEELGVVVVESNVQGIAQGGRYASFLTEQIISGYDQAPSSVDVPEDFTEQSTVALSQMTQNDPDGSWAVLYSYVALAKGVIYTALDEDTLSDPERSHAPSSIGGLIFDKVHAMRLWTSPNNPPVFTEDPIIAPGGIIKLEYNYSLLPFAYDPDPEDARDLKFSKVSGPDWLIVEPNGDIHGILKDSADVGYYSFVVSVRDPRGAMDETNLEINVVAAGQELPIGSRVSPAWVEKSCAKPLDIKNLDGSPIKLVVENRHWSSNKLWYADNATSRGLCPGVMLSPDNPVNLEFTYGWGTPKTQNISLNWEPTIMAGSSAQDSPVILRQGDSLLFKAGASGETLAIDVDGDGTVDYSGPADQTIPVQYAQAREYTTRATLDGEPLGAITVRAVSAAFQSPMAVDAWQRREAPFEIQPVQAINDVYIGCADLGYLKLEFKDKPDTECVIYVDIKHAQQETAQARTFPSF